MTCLVLTATSHARDCPWPDYSHKGVALNGYDMFGVARDKMDSAMDLVHIGMCGVARCELLAAAMRSCYGKLGSPDGWLFFS